MENLINSYTTVKECDHKGEHYSVRDNGSILRHPKQGKRKRPKDGVWTFGQKDSATGYMMFCGTRVHIIVATAFLGCHDSTVYIVDHIDTNRCNNRPENLRWLTRLENVLLNPITLSRVTYLCDGDINNFLINPACLQNIDNNPDLAWMRTVTPEEAQHAYKRVLSISALYKPEKKTEPLPLPQTTNPRNDDLEWFDQKYQKRISEKFNPPTDLIQTKKGNQSNKPFINAVPEVIFTKAKSPNNALQKDWKTPTDFPACPTNKTDRPLEDYLTNLTKDEIFSTNQYCTSVVMNAAITNDGKVLVVMTKFDEPSIKDFALVKVYFSGTQFVHESIGTFFSEDGAYENYCIALAIEYDGPDNIDRYC